MDVTLRTPYEIGLASLQILDSFYLWAPPRARMVSYRVGKRARRRAARCPGKTTAIYLESREVKR